MKKPKQIHVKDINPSDLRLPQSYLKIECNRPQKTGEPWLEKIRESAEQAQIEHLKSIYFSH
jgi:hypothetical protein